VTGSCEHGNEISVSIKDGEVLDWLNDYKLLDMDKIIYLFIYLFI
jgi:hypothetical protein